MPYPGIVRLLVVISPAISAVARGAAPEDLPVNQWVRVHVDKDATGYDYSRPVYVPGRRRVLHWGGVMARYRTKATPRDDVRAFDLATGRWVSDYGIADKPRYAPAGHGAPPLGVSYYGTGGMSPAGRPWPSLIFSAVCYDSKRERLVYTMKGLMAAYDPKTRRWTDMKARTVITGREYRGGPPAYGVGTCYDPVNDEILMQPHWTGAGDPKNTDLRDATGQVSSHLGTLRYSFKDNTWRRVGDSFGTEELRARRKAVIDEMGRLSETIDSAYVRRRRRDPGDAAAIVAAASARLRKLTRRLEAELRVEPPPRCGAPMVYDPISKAIVLFGGHSGLVRADIRPSGHLGSRPGALNDTWLYDVRTRQWRELKTEARPPVRHVPKLLFDPASKRVLLVTFNPATRRPKAPASSDIWSLDVVEGRWSYRGRQPWPGPLSYRSTYAARSPVFNLALDESRGVLVFTQNVAVDRVAWEETTVMRLDASQLAVKPAPPFEPDPPIVPQVIPPDDPAQVARLKALPPNTWTAAKPASRTATRRDWGNAACDPVRGWVVYFGGGHSTYQVNDVAIYAVGANTWVHAAGDHNDLLPPVGWGGVTMGYRGGKHAHHQRNQYVAVDGRMVVGTGGVKKVNRHGLVEAGRKAGPRYVWFYDVDRGGVWRQQTIDTVTRGEGVDGVWGAAHVADPSGRIFGFVGDQSGHHYCQKFPNFTVSIYDVYRNTLEVRSVPKPRPWRWPECRPFCYLAGKDRVFFYEYIHDRKAGPALSHRTMVYDVQGNAFVDLKPKRQPPGLANTVVFLPDQDAVFAVIDRKAQWVYSFKRNTWAPLPLAGARIRFTGPYSQVVYSAKYGVLVTPRDGTLLMRPDVSKAQWE